jgi:hypothetical protein
VWRNAALSRQRKAAQSSAKQCKAVQSSAKQCKAVQSSAKQCKAVQSSAKQYKAVQSSAKQCKAVQSSAKQCKAVQSSAKQCKAAQQRSAATQRSNAARRNHRLLITNWSVAIPTDLADRMRASSDMKCCSHILTAVVAAVERGIGAHRCRRGTYSLISGRVDYSSIPRSNNVVLSSACAQ